MGLALFPERLSGRVERAEDPADIALGHAERRELARYGRRVWALGRPEAAIAAAAVSRQIAPQPVCVTGPRQGVPCATMTQTVPRNLHSWQTLCREIAGLRPMRKALMTSSSWPLSIGHPRNSKSTGTCALIGVEVASVFTYSGCG